MHAISAEI